MKEVPSALTDGAAGWPEGDCGGTVGGGDGADSTITSGPNTLIAMIRKPLATMLGPRSSSSSKAVMLESSATTASGSGRLAEGTSGRMRRLSTRNARVVVLLRYVGPVCEETRSRGMPAKLASVTVKAAPSNPSSSAVPKPDCRRRAELEVLLRTKLARMSVAYVPPGGSGG